MRIDQFAFIVDRDAGGEVDREEGRVDRAIEFDRANGNHILAVNGQLSQLGFADGEFQDDSFRERDILAVAKRLRFPLRILLPLVQSQLFVLIELAIVFVRDDAKMVVEE